MRCQPFQSKASSFGDLVGGHLLGDLVTVTRGMWLHRSVERWGVKRSPRLLATHAVIKSMIRMIATALPVFWVPSVVSAFAQAQTSPFLTVNLFLF